MKLTKLFSAFAALVLSAASFAAIPIHAEDDDILYGDIRYSQALNMNRELGVYAGDTFDFSNVILEAVQYNWEGTASYVYSFTVGSGEFAELYTLDTAQVDPNTPGEYEVIIRPAASETGSFPYKSVSPVQYYDLRMKGCESAIPVKVYPKDCNADQPLYLRCYKEYIEMYCGGGVMIPLVGAYPARVEYAVADETIAKVQSSSPDYLELLGLKEGETTVTVRASDGRTTAEKVRVLPTAVTETEPPVLTTTARFNPDPPATAATVTVITPDPATATTKWWYQYETTEPAAVTAAVATEAMQDSATHTTAAELTDEVLPDMVRGDANCDGSIDVADAVLIARFAAEDREATMTDQGRKNADVTHDNNVDSQDAARILQYIAKKITFEDLAE